MSHTIYSVILLLGLCCYSSSGSTISFANLIQEGATNYIKSVISFSYFAADLWENRKYVEKLIQKEKDLEIEGQRQDFLKADCSKYGGTVVNSECYRYFATPVRTWDESREHCQSLGGDIWTPDLSDTFLYNNLFTYIPEMGGATNENLYIGAMRKMDGSVITIEDEDITDNFVVQNLNTNSGDCFGLGWKQGSLYAVSFICTNKQEVMCEFPQPVQPPTTTMSPIKLFVNVPPFIKK